jgi:hypothetical protein
MIATEAMVMSPTAEWAKNPDVGCIPPLYRRLQHDRQHFDQMLDIEFMFQLEPKKRPSL